MTAYAITAVVKEYVILLHWMTLASVFNMHRGVSASCLDTVPKHLEPSAPCTHTPSTSISIVTILPRSVTVVSTRQIQPDEMHPVQNTRRPSDTHVTLSRMYNDTAGHGRNATIQSESLLLLLRINWHCDDSPIHNLQSTSL